MRGVHESLSAISQPAEKWIETLNGNTPRFSDLIEAFDGTVNVYPWNVVTNGKAKSAGAITKENIEDKSTAMTGMYVDLSGSHFSGMIREFVRYLDMQDMAPTFITGRDMDGTLDYFHQGRMWWQVDWDKPLPRSTYGSNILQAAWGSIIQKHAADFGLCLGLPINVNPTFEDELYPLPGTNGVSMLWINDTESRTISPTRVEYATSTRIERIMDLRRDFRKLVEGPESPVVWDEILVPMGWHSLGAGVTPHHHWWAAPGSNGQLTAATEGQRLYLMQPNWLSGLKEANDAGILLNKWTVPCILGWDGDVTTFMGHWEVTNRLY